MARTETLDGRGAPTPDRPTFTLTDLRNQLGHGGVVSLVGELVVLHPGTRGEGFYSRRDFYVEPLVPPQIPELTDRRVDALNAAAYYKRQPTRKLATVPRQFVEDYNRALRDMLPHERFPGSTMPFGFVSNLASSRVNFGYRMYSLADDSAQVTQRTDVTVTDPELQRQLARVQRETHTATRKRLSDVRVRLFPPGLAERVHNYEKGYYVDGNVQEWEELVYKGRYISEDQLTPNQLQALARGEQPYPEVVYLPESEFQGGPDQIMELLVRRAIYRETETSGWRFGVGRPEIDDPTPEYQKFLAEHKRRGKELGVKRVYGNGDFGEDHPLMRKYHSRVGDPSEQHSH